MRGNKKNAENVKNCLRAENRVPMIRPLPANRATQKKMKNMKTLTTITYIGGNTERRISFLRAYTAKKPTYLGAARMVAGKLNAENDSCGEYPVIKPSEISICRIEFCDYQTR